MYADSKFMAEAQYYIGETYYEMENYEETISVYKRFLQNFPEHESIPAVLFHLGTAYYNLQKHEEAISSYQRLSVDFPNSEYVVPALFNTGLCYKKIGKLGEAAAVYAKFVEQYPNNKMINDILLELAAIYKDQFRYNLAINAFNELLKKLDPKDESRLEIVYNLSECYVETGDEKSMIDQYLNLRDMSPTNNIYRLRALAKLGEIYENKKEWLKAIDIYKDIAQNTDREDWRAAIKERIEVISEGMKKKNKSDRSDLSD
jgi:TolA-binding protein